MPDELPPIDPSQLQGAEDARQRASSGTGPVDASGLADLAGYVIEGGIEVAGQVVSAGGEVVGHVASAAGEVAGGAAEVAGSAIGAAAEGCSCSLVVLLALLVSAGSAIAFAFVR